jgi:hypothetical protein
MMSETYQDKVYNQVVSFLKRQGWDCSEKQELNAKRLDVRHGKSNCVVKIYSTGTVQIQGPESELKKTLMLLKQAIEKNEALPNMILPFEIEAFPDTLQQCIPTVDPIIVRFLSEAILCLKANSLLGCSFLLGAASEKAIWLLVDSYAQAIADEGNRTKFKERVSRKFISRAYDEFKKSFGSCKSKPDDPSLVQDLETQIDSIFQFCRICRNEVGHPQITPNLDKGVLLANKGQFIKYLEANYRLIDFFNNTKIIV